MPVSNPDDPAGADAGSTAPSGDDAVDASGETAADPDDGYGPTDGPSGREVVVPARLYKTVTVMSTLVAMASVVGGFVALDAATNRASAAVGEIDTLLALVGLGLIVGGAGVYAFATRFRAMNLGADDSADADAEGAADTDADTDTDPEAVTDTDTDADV